MVLDGEGDAWLRMEPRYSESQEVNTALLLAPVAKSHSQGTCNIFYFKSKGTWFREAKWGEKSFWTRTLKGHIAANFTHWNRFWSSGVELSARQEVRSITAEAVCGHSCAYLYCQQSSDKANSLLDAGEWSLIAWGIEIEKHVADILGPWPLRNYL